MAVYLYPPISVSTSTGPSSFILDGATTTVREDTVTPANNDPMPSKIFIQKDGAVLPVNKDTGTPANTLAIPVELVGASGPVNITAGDLNVQLTDTGANFDRTRIGDGTDQWEMNSSGEGLVHDADVLAELQAINTVQTDGTQTTKITDGAGTVNTKQLGTAVTNSDVGLVTNTVIHGLNSAGGGTYVDVKVNPAGKLLVEAEVTTSALPTGAATLAEQQAQSTLIGAVNETAPGTDTASSGLNGRLQRIAQRITSLIALIPTSLGQKTMANSFAVTLASDQSSIPVAATSATISGTITNAQVTVGTTAVRATVSGSAPNAARKKLVIKPSKNNSGTIYIGASSVTTANGLEFIGPDRLELEMDASDYYLISDTAAQTVEILEIV